MNVGSKIIQFQSNAKMSIDELQDFFQLLRIIETFYVGADEKLKDCYDFNEELFQSSDELVYETNHYYAIEQNLRKELYVKCLRIAIGSLILFHSRLNFHKLSFESLTGANTLAQLHRLRNESINRLKIYEQLLDLQVSNAMILCLHLFLNFIRNLDRNQMVTVTRNSLKRFRSRTQMFQN